MLRLVLDSARKTLAAQFLRDAVEGQFFTLAQVDDSAQQLQLMGCDTCVLGSRERLFRDVSRRFWGRTPRLRQCPVPVDPILKGQPRRFSALGPARNPWP